MYAAALSGPYAWQAVHSDGSVGEVTGLAFSPLGDALAVGYRSLPAHDLRSVASVTHKARKTPVIFP